MPAAGARPAVSFRFHARDLALLALALIGLSFPFFLVTSPDYFWHLRTGELIVRTGHPPYHDIFSFTAAGKTWLDHEWLAQVLIYGLQDTIRYAGLVFAFGAVGLASVAVIFYLLRKLEIPELVAIALCFVVMVLSLPLWQVRPATFSILLTAVFFAATHLYRRRKIEHLWYLVPLMVVWANLHGGYVMGLGFLGLLALSELASLDMPRAKHAGVVLVLCFLAAAVNPYTYRLWLYPFTYFVGDNASLSVIAEWQSPVFFHDLGSLPFGFAFLSLLVIGPGKKPDVWRIGLLLTFAALALQSVRHEVEFALVVPVVVAEAMQERWAIKEWPRRPATAFATKLHLVAGALLAVVTISLVASRGLQTGGEPRTDIPQLPFPVAGARFVAENYPQARMFNEYGWGGYLVSALPDEKVFIDGRADLYGKDLLKQYGLVRGLTPKWTQVLDHYQIDLILFPKDAPLASALRVDPQWREVFAGPVESVFVRSPL